MKRIICILITLSILVTCTSCGQKKAEYKPYSTTFRCFDTMCTVTIFDHIRKNDFETVRRTIVSKCNLLEDKFSKTRPGSFVKKLNKNKFFTADDESKDIINKSLEYSKQTKGAFDITVSPIVDLWGIDYGHFKIPSNFRIKKCLPLVDYKQINFNDNTVHLTKAGSIDLGAIAKGYATDELVKTFKFMGIKSALIDLGGNIYAYGSKDKKPFNIGIQKPFGKNELSATVKAKDTSVITAGIYQRYKERDGKIYSHIMNPKKGRPVDNDLNSVTVISKNATAADALSTGLMVMGLDKGLKFANSNKDIEAVFIDKDNKLHITDGLNINGKTISVK